jgi:hypothetical protein
MGKSIMQTERVCCICGRVNGLERHHVMAGTANRKLSEKYGLWVWVCHLCHTGRDGVQYNAKRAEQLKKDAEIAFIKVHGKKMWMETFGINYLDDFWRDEDDGER